MKLFIFAILIFSTILGVFSNIDEDYRVEFLAWMKKYDKVYEHDEFHYRYEIFKYNLKYIREYNSNTDSTFTCK